MKVRNSSFFKFWIGLSLCLFMTVAMLPSLIWCYEKNGRIDVEYGDCKSIHTVLASEANSVACSSDMPCGPCIDTPFLTVGLHKHYSYNLANFIFQLANTTSLNLLTAISDISSTRTSSSFDDTNSSLSLIQSTVLLI